MKKFTFLNCLTAACFLTLVLLPFHPKAQDPTTRNPDKFWYVGGNYIDPYQHPRLGTLDYSPLYLMTNGDIRMTFLEAGERAGIGFKEPEAQLHLHSKEECQPEDPSHDALGGEEVETSTSKGPDNFCNAFLMTNEFTTPKRNRGFIMLQENNKITLQQQEDTLFNIFGTKGEGMTIVPNGYVGFGTPYPKQKIHVVGENILISRTSSPKAPGSTNGSMLFGADVNNSDDKGEWGIEYCNDKNEGFGLNFWKTWTYSGSPLINHVLFLQNDGKVGIGTQFPQRELDVIGNMQVTGNINNFGNIYTKSVEATGMYVTHTASSDWSFASEIKVNRDLTKAFVITKNGGTVFSIMGNGIVNAKKIYAEEFEIHPNAMSIFWYDHVFNQDYKLRSLPELEQFIKTNKHLPEIPPEKEIKENGFNLGEMQGKLLLKIEELTLYLIEQQKLIEELQLRLSELESREGGE